MGTPLALVGCRATSSGMTLPARRGSLSSTGLLQFAESRSRVPDAREGRLRRCFAEYRTGSTSQRFLNLDASRPVEVVGLRFQVQAGGVQNLLGLWLLRGEACEERIGEGRLLHVADHGRVARAGEFARDGGGLIQATEGVYEPQPLGLKARVNAAVRDLAHPLLGDAAAFGDNIHELRVGLVHDRLEYVALLRCHLAEG